MEPARDERGDLKRGEDPDSTVEPQWSPLAMSGATRLTGHAGDRHGAAAMEPARDERGDRAGMTCVAQVEIAAMEPARDERGDRQGRGRRRRATIAAMEPARDERGDQGHRP